MNKKAKSSSTTPVKVHHVPLRQAYFGNVVPVTPAMGSADQKRSEESLKQLTGRLISAQEEERKRIARELHDDLNQRIAVIAIELEQLASTNPSFREAVKPIQKHVEEIGHDIHVMSHQLHPSKLDHLGLTPSIRSLCAETAARAGFEIEFIHDRVPTQLPKDVKLCMFRVAQEALQNAVRHGEASKVGVELNWARGEISLTVTDNGRGFVLTADKLAKGLGVTSMEERMRSIDGKLRIISKPGGGTVVEAIAPVPSVANN